MPGAPLLFDEEVSVHAAVVVIGLEVLVEVVVVLKEMLSLMGPGL